MSISQDPEMPGYAGFEKDAWAFKVRRIVLHLVSRLLASVLRPFILCSMTD